MNDSVEQVKGRLNAVEVIGQYVQLKKTGRNYSGRCPFHKERTPSFMVSPERGSFMCFGCGEKGDIFSFIEKIEGVDFKTALAQLADKAGIPLPTYKGPSSAEKEKDERLRDVCDAATAFFEDELRKRMPGAAISHSEQAAAEDVPAYLKRRGLSKETIRQWRVGYAPAAWEELSRHLVAKGFAKEDIVAAGLAVVSEKRPGEIFDRFRGRIMFPIFDVAGRTIAFSGRFFEKVPGSHEDGEPAKYVNSPETALFRKSRVLYGLNFARESIRKADCALLVEGQFDVLMSWQSGLRFAVAVSGTALTEEHLGILGRYSKRLVLALDGDAAGVRAGLKAAAMALAAGFDVKIPKLRGGKDPAELAANDPELLKTAVRGSQPAIEFFLDALKSSARDERAYKKLAEAQVLPLVAAIPSRIDQAHFISVVARQLAVPEQAVAAEVAKRPRLNNAGNTAAEVSKTVDEEREGSPMEKNAGMLLFSFDRSSSIRQKLAELLGDGRAGEIEVKLKPQTERLQFEFEALLSARGEGSDEALGKEMLRSIERAVLEDEIRAARVAISRAEDELDMKRAREFMGKLNSLLRRKEELKRA